MRVLVTGATGFVGSHLVKTLLSRGADVAVLVRDASRPRRIAELESHIVPIQGHLEDMERIRKQIVGFEPEITFHLGWNGANSVKYQYGADQVYRNVPGSLDLVRLVAEAGCHKFIGLGSVIEYGSFDACLREDLVAQPRNLYGAAKYSVGLLSEMLCRTYGIEYAWLRLCWGYGPDDDSARMIPYVIQTLLERKSPSLTPGEQYWDYLYIDDIVDALWRVATVAGATGVFNLASGEVRQIREIVEAIRDRIDPALPIGLGDVPYRADQVMRLSVDITKLKDATGWTPRTGLSDGLDRTIAWYESYK